MKAKNGEDEIRKLRREREDTKMTKQTNEKHCNSVRCFQGEGGDRERG